MMTPEIAIIGGSAAGLTAAINLKMRSPEKELVVIRNVRNTVVPCGIPYIFGTMKAVDKNIIPDSMFEQMNIPILNQNVEDIDTDSKTITLQNGEQVCYSKLILATGSKPLLPQMPGIHLKNVHAIRKDPDYLEQLFTAFRQARNIVVVGGGFIGVEVTEQLARMDETPRQLTIVEALPHCLMQAVEEEFCRDAESQLRNAGITIKTGSRVEALEGDDSVKAVRLANGDVIEADLVLIGLGATPNIDLARQIGLECNARDGILVDEWMQTSGKDIFAAGDCASKFSPLTKQPSSVRLGSTACTEGMIAASNLFSLQRTTAGAVGAFATVVGSICIGSVGFTSHAAKQQGIEILTGAAAGPNRHPAHLPGGIPDMKAILHFRQEDGVLVGGHIRGTDATAEIVNILAVATQAGLTAEQLATMQYATHPLLTASPSAYQIMMAAEQVVIQRGH
jgi:NADPH-dependent 2,4-dienoyl-CoA reductase/sulfur reductase-like enzyme